MGVDRLQLCICLSLGVFLEGLGAGAGLVYLVVLQETESVLGRFSSGMSASFYTSFHALIKPS